MKRILYFVMIIIACSMILISCKSIMHESAYESISQDEMREIEASDGKTYLLKNINMIAMTQEEAVPVVSILVENGIITMIGDLDNLTLPEDTIVLPSDGMYVIPGLSDMHVHANEKSSLKKFLAFGVTQVRVMLGSDLHLLWRFNINVGSLLGPEMHVSTLLVDGPNPMWPNNSVVLNKIEDVAPFIRSMKEKGYDFIKIYNNLSKDVFDEIMNVSKKENIRVAGHIPVSVTIEHAIEMGLWSSEHLYGHRLESDMTETQLKTIDNIASSELWVCPTPYVHRLTEQDATMKSYLKFSDVTKYMKAYKDAGGKIVSGTDEATSFVPAGISLHETLQIMVEAGFTPYEALETATINPAMMLSNENRLGTIEVGKDADMLILKSNPLDNIKNTQDIFGVMTKGRWLDEMWVVENQN